MPPSIIANKMYKTITKNALFCKPHPPPQLEVD